MVLASLASAAALAPRCVSMGLGEASVVPVSAGAAGPPVAAGSPADGAVAVAVAPARTSAVPRGRARCRASPRSAARRRGREGARADEAGRTHVLGVSEFQHACAGGAVAGRPAAPPRACVARSRGREA